MNDYRILCASEALSPITHMSRSEGNESLVAREPVLTKNGIRHLPVLSGNAIRHRMIRSVGARWLIESLDLYGKLSLPQLNFFFHGGNLTDGGGMENTRRIADMQRLFPFLRLVGGCLPNQILNGSVNVWRGTLVCDENKQYLDAVLSEEYKIGVHLRSAESEVSGYQYTRGDAAKQRASQIAPAATNGLFGSEEEPVAKSNLMIFAGQAVTRGSIFLHGFDLVGAGRLELGALHHSIQLWQSQGGTVGGQAARGHGRLQLHYLNVDTDDLDACAEEYKQHVKTNAVECVAWIDESFRKKETKEAKAKGGKKGKAKEPEEATADAE